MPQTSTVPPPSVKRKLPRQRHALWLEKTKKACEKYKLKESTPAGFEEFISRLPHYLRCIRNELKVRNYSPRSIKNYGNLSCDYLTWLSKEPSADDLEDIKRYQLFLKENKDYAPQTVNLATAAIIFMYNTVLGIPIEPTSLPRMKTGRPLPKVHQPSAE